MSFCQFISNVKAELALIESSSEEESEAELDLLIGPTGPVTDGPGSYVIPEVARSTVTEGRTVRPVTERAEPNVTILCAQVTSSVRQGQPLQAQPKDLSESGRGVGRTDGMDEDDATDEEMPRLVRRELMDSSDEDSDDEPPPLLTRDLLMESSSSESEADNAPMASSYRSPLMMESMQVSRWEQIAFITSGSEDDGESAAKVKWTGAPEFTETMWDEMLGEDSDEVASTSERSRRSEDTENPFRYGPWAVVGGWDSDLEDSDSSDDESLPPLKLTRFPCGDSSSDSDTDSDSDPDFSKCDGKRPRSVTPKRPDRTSTWSMSGSNQSTSNRAPEQKSKRSDRLKPTDTKAGLTLERGSDMEMLGMSSSMSYTATAESPSGASLGKQSRSRLMKGRPSVRRAGRAANSSRVISPKTKPAVSNRDMESEKVKPPPAILNARLSNACVSSTPMRTSLESKTNMVEVTEIEVEKNEEIVVIKTEDQNCDEKVMGSELSLELLIDELILTHGTQTQSDGIIVGLESTSDETALEEIRTSIVSTDEQVCTAGNQIWLKESQRTMQDSQSDIQASTILEGTISAGNLPQDDIFDVIYDEGETPVWSSDYEESNIKFVNTGNYPVFTRCFAAGIKLSRDPPAPHIEDLTVATVETGAETDYSERLENIIGSIRTQVQSVRTEVKHKETQAFLAGIKYHNDVEHYCAVDNDGHIVPPVPFPDLLGDVEPTPPEEVATEIAVRDHEDFRNLKRGEHDYMRRSRRHRNRNRSQDKRRNGRFPKSRTRQTQDTEWTRTQSNRGGWTRKCNGCSRLGHQNRNCHNQPLRKSTKKNNGGIFNLKQFGKFYRKEQTKKQRAKERAEKDRKWRNTKVLTLLKVALSATYNNPDGALRHMRPTIAGCIDTLEGRDYYPSPQDRPFTKQDEAEYNHFMSTVEADDVAFMSKEEEEDFTNFTKDTWFADSAASTHMGNTDDGMFDYEDINEKVTVGNGKTVWAKKKGKIRLTVIQMDGSTAEVVLHNYQFVPALDCKLCAIIKSTDEGFSITNDGPSLILTRGKLQIKFDRIMYTKGGRLCGVEMVARTHSSKEEIALKVTEDEDKSKKPSAYWNINRMHLVFNHAGEEALRRTAKAYNWTLTGKLEPCEHCKIANAKQKDVPKTTETRSEKPGERVFLDISYAAQKTMGGSKFWLLMVDDATGMAWSRMLKKKSDTTKEVMSFLRRMKARGTPVKYIRCDNSGENKDLDGEVQREPRPYRLGV